MSDLNDTSIPGLPAIPDVDPDSITPVTVFFQRAGLASEWLTYAKNLITAGGDVNPDDVLLAICNANDNLADLETMQMSFEGFVAGVETALQALVAQRDEALRDYEQLEETFEARLHAEVGIEVSETVAQIFASEDEAEEAEIDMLARRMVTEDEEDVISEETKRMARRLRAAKELAAEYRANGIPGEDYIEEVEEYDNDDELAN